MSGTWASGWVAGDIVTAAEFAKGAGAIHNTTLGVAAANVDVTGIIDDYAHLLIVAYLRGDTAATSTGCNLRLNNDSAGNYYWQELRGNLTTASATESLAGTSITVSPVIPAGTAPANSFGLVSVLIANYANATSNKPTFSQYFGHRATSTSNQFAGVIGGIWKATAAVTRVTLLPAAGNFDAGSRVTIYGLGA